MATSRRRIVIRQALVVSVLVLAVLGGNLGAQSSGAARLKDVATLQGYPPVPLLGYGLVVGLNKTGDRRQTIFTAQTLANMLEKLGVTVPGEAMKVENIAAVLVTGELPAFSRTGARLDVTVSSVGDARSLQGGTLLATGLHGPDGTIHVIAQGSLTLGGFGGGSGGNSVQVNHLTAGRVPGGGLVQVPQRVALPREGDLLLTLGQADYASASQLAISINNELGPGTAQAVDAGTVSVNVPTEYKGAITDLMARIEPLPVYVDTAARVVINERTGTVVVGSNVRISAAAVAHGNLSVKISTRFDVSQPAPFSERGQTVVVPQQEVDVEEGDAKLVALQEGTTLDAVVRALNELGATPRDIIAIMQALRAAGALRAEIVVL
jgi:flagellar P-ring protein precursor FlgI